MHTKSEPRLETAGDLIPSEIHPRKIHASVAFGFPQASLRTLWGQHVIPGGPQFVPRLPNDRGVISQASPNNAPGIPYIPAGSDPGCASRPQGHLQPQLDCLVAASRQHSWAAFLQFGIRSHDQGGPLKYAMESAMYNGTSGPPGWVKRYL